MTSILLVPALGAALAGPRARPGVRSRIRPRFPCAEIARPRSAECPAGPPSAIAQGLAADSVQPEVLGVGELDPEGDVLAQRLPDHLEGLAAVGGEVARGECAVCPDRDR